MKSLKQSLQYARPFGPVTSQLEGSQQLGCQAYTSIEPSRAAVSSICSLESIMATRDSLAQNVRCCARGMKCDARVEIHLALLGKAHGEHAISHMHQGTSTAYTSILQRRQANPQSVCTGLPKMA